MLKCMWVAVIQTMGKQHLLIWMTQRCQADGLTAIRGIFTSGELLSMVQGHKLQINS